MLDVRPYGDEVARRDRLPKQATRQEGLRVQGLRKSETASFAMVWTGNVIVWGAILFMLFRAIAGI